MKYGIGIRNIVLAGACAVIGVAAWAQNLGYSDTPFLPGGKWRVHDGTRPQPKLVDPGAASTQESAAIPVTTKIPAPTIAPTGAHSMRPRRPALTTPGRTVRYAEEPDPPRAAAAKATSYK